MHHSADIDRYAQSISASHLFVQSNDHQAVRRGCARLRCARIPQHLRLADRQLLFLSLLLLFLLADSSAKCSTRDTLTPITTTTTTAASLLAALSEAAPSPWRPASSPRETTWTLFRPGSWGTYSDRRRNRRSERSKKRKGWRPNRRLVILMRRRMKLLLWRTVGLLVMRVKIAPRGCVGSARRRRRAAGAAGVCLP